MPAATARRLLLLLPALTTLALTSTTSALAAAGPQNRVWAKRRGAGSHLALRPRKRLYTPGSVGSNAQIASGFCVAAEEAGRCPEDQQALQQIVTEATNGGRKPLFSL